MSNQSAKWQKIIVFVFWLLIILSFWIIARTQDITFNQLLQQLVSFAKEHPLGIGAVFVSFLIRPILLLPSTLLVVAAGYLYGIVFGFLLSMVATLLSLVISYYLAAYFRPKQLSSADDAKTGLGKNFVTRLQQNTFESTLIARLIFMPGDVVNFAAGFCKVNLPAFLLASAIGGTPGGLMAVLAGASIEGDFDAGNINIRISYLIAASLILLASLGLSWLIRKKRSN